MVEENNRGKNPEIVRESPKYFDGKIFLISFHTSQK